MPLGKHKKTESGRMRKERGDSQAGNLSKDYSEFKNLPPKTRLDSLEKKFGVSGINQVRKALRNQDK